MAVNVPPVFTSAAPPSSGTVGAAYNHSFTASGSTPIIFSVTSGALPDGLTLTSGGVIFGTPTTSGAFSGTITASNGTQPNATQDFSIVIGPAPVAPQFTSAPPLSSGTVGVPYIHILTVWGTTPIIFWESAGALPDGVILGVSGIIVGTPTTTGTFHGTITAYNGTMPNATQDYSIVIGPALVPEIAVEQPAGTNLVDGSASINCGSASVGNAASTLTFTVKNTGTADLTGIGVTKSGPNAADFIVTALGASPLTAGTSTTFNLTFTPGGAGARTATLHIASNDAAHNPFDINLSGTGVAAGNDILTFDFGALGLATIIGTNISVTVPYGTNVTALVPTFTMSAGATCDHVSGTSYNFTDPVTYTVFAAGFITKTYAVTVGFTPPNDNFADAITLPGISGSQAGYDNINATFQTGEPVCVYPDTSNTVWFKWVCTQAGEFTISTTGSLNASGGEWDACLAIYSGSSLDTLHLLKAQDTGYDETMTVTVSPGTYYIQLGGCPSPSPDVATNMHLTWSLVARSAKDILTFDFGALGPAIISGTNISLSVPAGTDLTLLTPTYTISPLATGNPPSGTVGNFTSPQTYTVTAQDGSTKSYTVTVCVPPVLSSSPPTSGTVGTAYNHTLTASGSTPITFAVTSGALPTGLTLVSGVITGTPSAPGTFSGTITASNGILPDATQNFSIVIGAAPVAPQFTSGPLPSSGTVGVPYIHILKVWGTTPIIFWESAGALPDGVILGVSGIIVGTPTTTGTFHGSITAYNGTMPNATQDYSIVIGAAPVAPQFTSAPPASSGNVGVAYNHALTASGSTPITYTVTSGVLPGGLTLVSGAISGTPNATGTFSGTITASNGIQPNATQDFTIVIGPALVPEIAVEQPAGTDLTDGGALIDCGSVNVGSSSVAIAVTVKNTGTADLTGLVVTHAGINDGDFSVGTLGASTLAPGTSTTFSVSFTPGSAGSRVTTLLVFSNDSNKNPFHIGLRGTGLRLPSTAADMLTFGIGDNPAVIAGAQIVQTLPYGTVLTALAPTFTVSPLATGVPSSGTARNFSTPQTYAITAEDGTTSNVYTVTVNVAAPSVAKEMLAFDFPGLPATTIFGNDITVTVPHGTGLTSLAPTFTVSPFASCVPASGTAGNFSGPQTYTVTAQDGSSRIYTVTVSEAPASPAKDMLAFVFPGLPEATLLGSAIRVTVPYGTNVTALAPTYTVAAKATGSPAPGTVRNFTSSQTYTITAEDLTTRSYEVTVNVAPPSSAKEMLSLVFPGQPASAISGTSISVNVPYGTDVTNLAPTYTVSPLAHGSTPSGTSRNFTNPRTYTVTAEDGSTIDYQVTVHVTAASQAKDVLSWVFPGLPAATMTGTEVSVTVPYGTNVTALAPTYTVSPFATGAPLSGSMGNFSTPQSVTITAQDGSTKTYTVTVNVAAASQAKDMLVFGGGGVITGTLIALTVPYGTELASFAPGYTVSPFATGEPAPGTPRDFTTAQSYTVTAQDLSTRTYMVTVSVASASAAKDIMGLVFPGLSAGLIVGNQISVTVPYGTDVTLLAPTYALSAYATCAPGSGTPQDFSTPQTYTVTAQDHSTKDYSVTVNVAGASAVKDLLAFEFPGLGAGSITGTNISVSVPYGTNVMTLVPSYTVSTHATCSPATGVAMDFSIPQSYTVTAQDHSTKVYSVNVTVAGASPAKDMLSLVFPGQPACTITGTNIRVTVPYGTDVTSMAPSFTISANASSAPLAGTTRNFSSPRTYTVTAQDGSTTTYTVTVTVAPASPAKDVLTCVFPGLPATRIVGSNIQLTVPYGTDVKSLAPEYTVSANATGLPVSGTPGDFSVPQSYVITAQDGSARSYVVSVSESSASQTKEMLTFGPGGIIGGSSIVMHVPYGTNVTTLAPSYTVSPFATGTPPSGTAMNFTSPQIYQVSAQDASTKNYTVSVIVAPVSTAKDILSCHLGGFGAADIDGSRIIMPVPTGTVVTSLAPTCAISPLASISPASGSTRDFTQPVEYTVSAQDSSTKVYTLEVGLVLSANANLSDLALSDGTLSPAFDPATIAYAAMVPYRTSRITLTATKAESRASLMQVRLNGGSALTIQSAIPSIPLDLNIGVNSIAVAVTAEDGTLKTYRIDIQRAAASADPLYHYDFNSTDVFPDLPTANTTGRALGEIAPVAGGTWRQRTSGVDGWLAFVFPDPSLTGGGFEPGLATFAEARLNVLKVSGFGGIHLSIADGAHLYRADFAPGGVYVGANPGDATRFVPLDLTGYHTYRLESPPNSDTLYFSYDGQVVFVTTGQVSSSNGFEWGDAMASAGNGGDADWDYVTFGQASSYAVPSCNASLANLTLSAGRLTPSFFTGVSAFSVSVPNATSGITVTPSVAAMGTVARVNGTAVASGAASTPILLNVGNNVVTIVSTAVDGITTKTYTVAITRAAPVGVTTNPANSVTSSAATLNGTVNPNGSTTAFYEYGLTSSYGLTTAGQVLVGTSPIEVQALLSGLSGNTLYHFRLVADNDGARTYGGDLSFTTAPTPPVVATGNPVAISTSGASLVGLVNPMGLPARVHFEYGQTILYGTSTPEQIIPAGSSYVDVVVPVTGLLENGVYQYRIVATTEAGTSLGNNMNFQVIGGGGSGTLTGSPTAKPGATTDGLAAITADSASLLGSVNPHDGPTVARFEYGTTTGYGQATRLQPVGNGNAAVTVSLPAEGLLPGTLYHFRLSATNSLGTEVGLDAEFATKHQPPLVETGDAVALSTTSAQVAATVRARNSVTEVFFDYGTDPANLSRTVQTTPRTVAGDGTIEVNAVIDELAQGAIYYYQVRAKNSEGSEVRGNARSLEVAMISGLLQQFPDALAATQRQGSLQVVLSPAGIGGGWRLLGEQAWRLSGATAAGLASGDRVIEYRSVPGYIQPASETAGVVSGQPTVALDRAYTPSGSAGSGGLTVTLKPESITSQGVPEADRGQWRLFGESDAQWKNSGADVTGLPAGSHVIECKPVAGRATPAPVTARISDGETGVLTITYFVAQAALGKPPAVLSLEIVTSRQDLPYAYVGQIRSEVGASTGFVVRPRVVATAGHVVWDDGTLKEALGMQWLFQRDSGVYEPRPQIPRGFFLLTGYAAQREADHSPGTSTPLSQHLDAAALFFLEDAGRGGFGGYLASDTTRNEFLLSSALKTLVGYPVDGIPPAAQGRMHATPLDNVAFTAAYGRTYTTNDIRSSGGNSGGPLCVQYDNGNYYPAAIYLGGTAQTVVRAIDSEVTTLFGLAEANAGGGTDRAGGNVTELATALASTPTLGSLQVMIEPSSARMAGAGWKIDPLGDYQQGGFQQDNVTPGAYTVQFPTVAGFLPSEAQRVTIHAGELTQLTFTYDAIILPPVINSAESVTGIRTHNLGYQITATNTPDFHTVWGVLPAGLSLDGYSGWITGTLQEAGKFTVIVGARNAGGAATQSLVISSLPVLDAQATTVFYEQAMNYRIASSESAVSAIYTAAGLPEGLTLNASSGRITGTPTTPGVFQIPLTVTRREATSAAVLTLNVTGTRPAITQQPAANKTIAYGGSTTLSVAADGLPAPAYQWYLGASGATAQPVPGATGATFTTPPLTGDTSYWVRAMSISGSVDSTATAIHVLPSSNSNLSRLTLSAGTLAPAFNAGILTYRVEVPYAIEKITLTPTVEVPPASVRINGIAVSSGWASSPINLQVGTNTIVVEVTAADLSAHKTYTLTVSRAGTASCATGTATAITDAAATLNGTVVPNGGAAVYFQYGLNESYGNATPEQNISAMVLVPVHAVLSGLLGNTIYHYRIAVRTAAGTIHGNDWTFTTALGQPQVVTGMPVGVTGTGATLTGAVNPRGLDTTVVFEYGPTTQYGTSTLPQNVSAGSTVVDVREVITGLTTGTTYHYRIVATSSAGTSRGADREFSATPGVSTGDGYADAPPSVETVAAADLTTSSAALRGVVNPNDGTTSAYFHYGTTSSYGDRTNDVVLGNGSQPVNVTLNTSGLLPDTLYHFQLVATNSLGESSGQDLTFTTGSLPPLVTTGHAEALSSASVRLSGTVLGRGSDAMVWFDYGTDGLNWESIQAFETSAPAGLETAVSVNLLNLHEQWTYYFRVRAISAGVTGTGDAVLFQVGALVGLVQDFPREVPAGDHLGQVLVDLAPAGVGAWRFVGEPQWRLSGLAVTGLTTGPREIEFQPVSGYNQPPLETITIVSDPAPMIIERMYYAAGALGSGALVVMLEPQSLAGGEVAVSSRLQWRLAGESTWKNSGEAVSALMPGSYLVECKPVSGRSTPLLSNVLVRDGATSTITITYFPASAPNLNPPVVLSFTTISTSPNMPYAYVGQFQSNTGSYSGFVVKSRVVATVGQAVFDDATLAASADMKWLLQRDAGNYEPEALVPRGFYVFNGYADQRRAEGTPGVLLIASQNLNVATLYFPQDAGRGGFSGFLASDADTNEFLQASAQKTLVGYPMAGIAPEKQGRMHATAPLNAIFAKAASRTYTTGGIRGIGGMTGGPLCVQYQGGAYYPAGIYVGGTTQSAVRAIDSGVSDLFSRAEISGNGGDNNTGGGITHTSFTSIGSGSNTQPGALKVTILPQTAISASAGWQIKPETTYRASGTQKVGLNAGSYILQLKTVSGFQAPTPQTVTIAAGQLQNITFTYQEEVPALDAWRMANFGTYSNTADAVSADGVDPDGDGQTNLAEYVAGTDPNKGADFFRILTATKTGTSYTVTAAGKAGRVYMLERKATLASGIWSAVDTKGALAADGTVTLTDTAPPANTGFYRLRVTLP